MCLEDLYSSLFGVSLYCTNGPYVCTAVFTSTDDVLAVVCECGSDLTAGIFVSAELGLQGSGTEIVHSDARVIASDQELNSASDVALGDNHRIDAGDFATLGISPTSRSNVDLG
jgi:hypothetical protein